MKATVWYNPRCNTCRRVRAALEGAGAEVELVAYMEGRDRADWEALVDAVGGDPTRLLRAREPLYKDLKLEQKIAQGKLGRKEVLDLLVKHPQLLERPVVLTPSKAMVVRPAERVKELL